MNDRISGFLQSRIDAGDFPSAVYTVAEKGAIVFRDALGNAVVEPERIAARIDTIYDLASLTKVLVTGLLCAKLIEKKELELGRTIDFYFPEFDVYVGQNNGWDTSIGELLTHISDFPAWKPFYLLCEKRSEISAEIIRMPLGFNQPIVTYSDLNFIFLMFLIEKLCGKRIDQIAKEEIFEPLNLQDTFYNPPKGLRKRIAASEKGNAYEKQTCIEQRYDVSKYNWRDYQIWGEVHDGNCYFMDGVSGHAGLFSTAEETFKIAQQFLANQTIILKPETCRLFRTNFTEGFNEARSLAFQLAATPESTASRALAPDSFGHLGFTGTSLWIEPESERVFILLTNRTHAHELPFVNINSVRRRFHEIAQNELNSKR
ncbi:MAG TPA: serine hydrolase [Pyrinomonadaceae bacterium]|jgi:CubicO group peptidase (beta-lactamase class C family)